jgi:L-ascorbate metabolism protein UlaG (beta-lactamase superfamily)
MSDRSARVTLIGGPTVLIEIDGFRLLTDPTFDPPGRYPRGAVTLEKLAGPALSQAEIGPLDAVLLSHDQHADNLDDAGRAMLRGTRVLTTAIGATRLGNGASGLAPWDSIRLSRADGRALRITATPARHGPPDIEPIAGDVVGFLVAPEDGDDAIYVTGDTVWYEGVAEIARRSRPRLVILFAGAAEPRGRFHVTMDSNDAMETAHAFPDARILAVHNEGWAHFSEGPGDLSHAFAALGLGERLVALRPGETADVPV